MPFIDDTARAFMPYPPVPVPQAPTGPLAGLSFAVKDLFHVAGYPTSGGSSARQRSWASTQRSAKAQPTGSADKSGGAPGMVASRPPLAIAPWARLISSARV